MILEELYNEIGRILYEMSGLKTTAISDWDEIVYHKDTDLVYFQSSLDPRGYDEDEVL